jgi:hypothetical protein
MRLTAREPVVVAVLLAGIVGVRLAAIDQPIVENYVGRQIPTAMVARNLERGCDLWRPRLDTGPFPNYFLVEPPIYQAALLAVRRVSGLEIGPAGRATSALATGLGALGLYLLVRRRRGPGVAALAALVFGLLPVTLRYGRAAQPDMLALALATAGLACWDRWANGGRWPWAVSGWTLVALGLATKVLWIFALLPMALIVAPRLRRAAHGRRSARGILLAGLLLSELAIAGRWYASASPYLSAAAQPARASAEAWLAALGPSALLKLETWHWIAHFGFIRAFTPLAVLLVFVCLWRRLLDAVWVAWLLGALATLLAVAGKLHHEYYWLLLAPPVAAAVAVWLGRSFEAARLEGRVPWDALAIGGSQIALSLAMAWSTWTTPDEWRAIEAQSAAIARAVPPEGRLVAREAVLYYADRRGMRLEHDPPAIARAIAEWRGGARRHIPRDPTPDQLLSCYDANGATHWAEVGDPLAGRLGGPSAAAARRAAARVLIDQPGLLVVELGGAAHAQPEAPDP